MEKGTGEEKEGSLILELAFPGNNLDFMGKRDIREITDTPGYLLLKANYTRFFNELSSIPVPNRDYPLDGDRVKEYIEQGKHSDITTKHLRQLIIDHTYYISLNDLVKYMCQALDGLLEDLEGRPWVIIMYNTEYESYDYTKSYGWIFRLCLDKCLNIRQNLPLGILMSPTDLEVILPLVESGYLRDFVILDDISYSGHQIRALANYTRERLHDLNIEEDVFKKINISAVVAVIAGTAVLFNNSDKYNIHKIPILYGKKIDGFSDLLSKDELREIQDLHTYGGIPGAPNIYASHKLPDEYSILVTEIAPLISGCEMFYKDGKKFDALTPPCPTIPYKNVKYTIDMDYKHYSDYLSKTHQIVRE